MNMTDETSRKIVIGMPLKNGARHIRRAIESVLNQKGVERDFILLIVDDNSTDNWREICKNLLDDERIRIITTDVGRVYALRNFILEYVNKNIPDAEYIGRLDSDDYIAHPFALRDLEKIINKYSPDIIISGNLQILGDEIIGENRADRRLLDDEYLEKRLYQMANGVLAGELPSCNVFVKPTVGIRYRDTESAEDHWYLVDLLLNKDKYKIYVANNLIYSVYNLGGKLSIKNKNNNIYIKSRKKLYEYFIDFRGDIHGRQ